MPFHVVYSEIIRARVEQLLLKAKVVGWLREIKQSLTQLHDIMETDPVGFGEPLYRLHHVELTVHIVVRRFMSVKYAADEVRNIVYVIKFSFSGHHPYPPSLEEILNPML